MSDKNFPVSGPDSSKPILLATDLKGNPGDPAIVGIGNPASLAVPTDSSGNNPVYTNAFIYLAIYSGNVLLAEGATTNGWTASIYSASDVTFSISGLVLHVTGLNADEGAATIKLSKTGYADVYTRVKIYKAKAGATGSQGVQGVKGDQGAKGDPGSQGVPGTGYVVVKHTVEVKAPVSGVASGENAPHTRLTFTSNAGIAVGDMIMFYDQDAANYNVSSAKVLAQVDANAWEVDAVYTAGANIEMWSKKHFAKGGVFVNFDDTVDQILEFPAVVPVGAKLDQFIWKRTAITQQDARYLVVNAGYAKYPAAGFDAYIAGLGDDQTNWKQVDLWVTTRPEYTSGYIALSSDNRVNIYVRGTKYAASDKWSTEFGSDQWLLAFSYKFFG